VEREREAEAKRQQNQMPAWHLTSTISGDLTALGIAQQARDAAMQSPTHILDSLSPFTNTKPIEGLPEANDVKPVIGAKIGGLPVDMKPVVNHQADYYDRYYAQLEAGPSQAKADDAGSWDGSDEEDVKPSLIELEFQRTRKRTRSNSPVAGIDTSLDRGSKFLRTADGPVLSRSGSGSLPPTTETTPDGTGENTPSEDTLVSVNGIQMPFSTVTEEHHDMMTPDEYTAYFEVYQRVSG